MSKSRYFFKNDSNASSVGHQQNFRPIESLKFFLFFLASTLLHSTQAQSSVLLKSNQQAFSQHHIDQIKEDAPIQNIIFGQANELWFIGQKMMWKWDSTSKKLKKITLYPKQKKKLLIFLNDSIYTTTHDFILKISQDPLRVTKIKIRRDKEIISMQSEGEKIFLIYNDRIDLLNKRKITPSIYQIDNDTSYQKALFISKSKALFMSKEGQLDIFDLEDKRQKKSVLKLKNKIYSLEKENNFILTHTRHSAIRLSNFGSIIQTFPIESQRSLISVNINNNKHSYLYNDSLLEVKDIEKKTTKYYFLNLPKTKKVSQLLINNRKVALVLDGLPYLFDLTGQTYTQKNGVIL